MGLSSILRQFIKDGFESASMGIPLERGLLSKEEDAINKEVMKTSVKIINALCHMTHAALDMMFPSGLIDQIILLLDSNKM